MTSVMNRSEMHIREGARHADFDDARLSFDAEATALAWQRPDRGSPTQ